VAPIVKAPLLDGALLALLDGALLALLDGALLALLDGALLALLDGELPLLAQPANASAPTTTAVDSSFTDFTTLTSLWSDSPDANSGFQPLVGFPLPPVGDYLAPHRDAGRMQDSRA
jgi:hypothetical protein